MVSLYPNNSNMLELNELIAYPMDDERLTSIISMDELKELGLLLKHTSPDSPVVSYNCKARLNNEIHSINIICRSVWNSRSEFCGAIGKAADLGIA